MYFFIFIKFFKKKFLIYIFIVNSCEHKNHDSCTFNSILVSLNVYHKEIYGVSLAVFFLFFFSIGYIMEMTCLIYIIFGGTGQHGLRKELKWIPGFFIGYVWTTVKRKRSSLTVLSLLPLFITYTCTYRKVLNCWGNSSQPNRDWGNE